MGLQTTRSIGGNAEMTSEWWRNVGWSSVRVNLEAVSLNHGQNALRKRTW